MSFIIPDAAGRIHAVFARFYTGYVGASSNCLTVICELALQSNNIHRTKIRTAFPGKRDRICRKRRAIAASQRQQSGYQLNEQTDELIDSSRIFASAQE